jgi:IS605 OrfB family transposase
VNQQLYAVANQILEYAKQFPKPVIVMEDLNGMRGDFKMSKNLNRRFHSLPFRSLQTNIKYEALLEVRYLAKEEIGGTSGTFRRCWYAAQIKGREFKCLKYGLTYIGI